MLLAVVLAATWKYPRTNRARASMVLWGGWLLVTGLVFSLAQGIIHPYYTVALAPAIGAIVGIGSWFLWCRRDALWARLAMGSVVAGSSIWAAILLDRVPAWHPWLRTVIPVVGCIAGALLVVSAYRERFLPARVARSAVVGVTALAILAGPGAYTLATVATPHSGAIPSAGPSSAALAGFPGGGAPGGAPPGEERDWRRAGALASPRAAVAAASFSPVGPEATRAPLCRRPELVELILAARAAEARAVAASAGCSTRARQARRSRKR